MNSKRLGYKKFDRVTGEFTLMEVGVYDPNTEVCTVFAADEDFAAGKYWGHDLPWWEVEDEESGFYLID